jgi:hypothetical protein
MGVSVRIHASGPALGMSASNGGPATALAATVSLDPGGTTIGDGTESLNIDVFSIEIQTETGNLILSSAQNASLSAAGEFSLFAQNAAFFGGGDAALAMGVSQTGTVGVVQAQPESGSQGRFQGQDLTSGTANLPVPCYYDDFAPASAADATGVVGDFAQKGTLAYLKTGAGWVQWTVAPVP